MLAEEQSGHIGFKTFKLFKPFQPLSLSSPAVAGEDEEGGLNEALWNTDMEATVAR